MKNIFRNVEPCRLGFAITACLKAFGIVAVLIVMLADVPAIAACDLTGSERGVVSQVLDGETFVMADHRQVRLINAGFVKLSLVLNQNNDRALADAAKAALTKLVGGKTVVLRYGGRAKDRYGRILAQVYLGTSEGQWVQGAMVSQGFARVYSFHDNQACLEELLTREKQARQVRIGLWNVAAYHIKSAQKIKQLTGVPNSFQLVEGRVRKVAKFAKRIFLNFGEDWKRDFTITIPPAAVKLFTKAKIDLSALAGHKIRVRGWIELRNGPSIEVTHPGQIELLNAGAL
jgi:endonuclease YncB( thermonuclease family)